MFTGINAMGAAGWILMLAFWVALLALIVWGVLRLLPRAQQSVIEPRSSAQSASEILDRRLASGEIDIDSYEQLRAKLDPPSAAERR